MLIVEAQPSEVLHAFHMQSPLLIPLDRSAVLIRGIADSLDRGLQGFLDNLCL